jgi:DNA-binding transcriptional MerR regulator/methylmalonyl-CoA mutase cobalamin-binding subunit
VGSYTIKAVAERTGLSAHTIRAWERRYGALEPNRTGTNRRSYTEEDVRRLQQLKQGVQAGHSIGMIAALPAAQLSEITAKPKDADLLEPCLSAVKELDALGLEIALNRAFTSVGLDRYLDEVVLPLIAVIDRGWVAGEIGISQEHMVSSLIRTNLQRLRLSLAVSPVAPRLLVTTPARQVHELGALLIGIRATQLGWQVIYLGPDLPAADIARAAKQVGARAVALSVVYPEADPLLSLELRSLRAHLPEKVSILVGGRAARTYSEVLEEIGAFAEARCGSLEGCLNAVAG